MCPMKASIFNTFRRNEVKSQKKAKKIPKNLLTTDIKAYIIDKHELSDEAKCGYTLTE